MTRGVACFHRPVQWLAQFLLLLLTKVDRYASPSYYVVCVDIKPEIFNEILHISCFAK